MNEYTTILLQQNKRIFHTQDLAILWNITNKNTLYTTIKRYIDRHILFPIQKSLYSTVPPEQVNPIALGLAALHRPAYCSCETVLIRAGYLNQVISEITFVSEQSKQFIVGGHRYRSRQLSDAFLYNPIGIEKNNGVAIASPERAAADLLYFNPRVHFDAPVDWARIKQLQKKIGYPITQRS